MPSPGAAELSAAVDSALTVLSGGLDQDWTAAAGPLEWTCRQTAVHVAHDLMAYAGQLTSGSSSAYLPVDWTVRDDADLASVLAAVRTAGDLLALTVAHAPARARAWHWGPTDATGFAALGMNEVLVHTWDISQGLQLGWVPPPELAGVVLARLFPGAPAAGSAGAGEVLLWCTGRTTMDGRPQREEWLMPRAALI